MRSGVRSPYAPPFIQKGPLKAGPFCVAHNFLRVILAALRRGIDDGNEANPTKEDRHFVNVAIAFLVASFCTCPFAMLV